jgi:hypothetical protein
MATEEMPGERLLRELYEVTGGQATTMVRSENLARRIGLDPDDETDEARFLGAARRLEEKGYLIANKTGSDARDYSSLSLTHAGIRAVEEGPAE